MLAASLIAARIPLVRRLQVIIDQLGQHIEQPQPPLEGQLPAVLRLGRAGERLRSSD